MFARCAAVIAARLSQGLESPSQPADHNVSSHPVDPEHMDRNAQRQKRRENVLSLLDVAIETLTLAKEVSSITPAKAVFGSVSTILTMIRVNSFLC